MSSSSSISGKVAYLDDCDEEQDEDEDMLLTCVLFGEYLSEKEDKQHFMLET